MDFERLAYFNWYLADERTRHDQHAGLQLLAMRGQTLLQPEDRIERVAAEHVTCRRAHLFPVDLKAANDFVKFEIRHILDGVAKHDCSVLGVISHTGTEVSNRHTFLTD